MTIDERIEKLIERHEALSQTLELIAAMHKDLERETDARFAETAARFADLGQFINQLAHIAEAHEHRTDRIEGQR